MKDLSLCAECLDYRVGVKSVWLLVKRGKWRELAKLGLNRDSAEVRLHAYLDANMFGTGGKLRSNRQVYDLIQAYPPLLNAAVLLVHMYLITMSSELPQVDKEYVRMDNSNEGEYQKNE